MTRRIAPSRHRTGALAHCPRVLASASILLQILCKPLTRDHSQASVHAFQSAARLLSCPNDVRRRTSTPPPPHAPCQSIAAYNAAAKDSDELWEPTESDSSFGRKGYWDDFYRRASSGTASASDPGANGKQKSSSDGEGAGFSWYADWTDIEPFFVELVPDREGTRVLLPGVGNDESMVDMYDSGYCRLSAFDYAPEAIECARRIFGSERLREGSQVEGVDLRVADARRLPYGDDSFDAVLEKGTLDAVYLSGGANKERGALHLSMAVSELARIVRPGGVVFSITAACVEAVEAAFEEGTGTVWKQLRDGTLHITEDGHASINVDGTMLAWERI